MLVNSSQNNKILAQNSIPSKKEKQVKFSDDVLKVESYKKTFDQRLSAVGVTIQGVKESFLSKFKMHIEEKLSELSLVASQCFECSPMPDEVVTMTPEAFRSFVETELHDMLFGNYGIFFEAFKLLKNKLGNQIFEDMLNHGLSVDDAKKIEKTVLKETKAELQAFQNECRPRYIQKEAEILPELITFVEQFKEHYFNI